MEATIEEGSWEPIMLSHRSLVISHFFFTDDLLLFGRATTQEEVAAYLYANLGFSRLNDLGKYLGMPFFHRKVGINTFRIILDKLEYQLRYARKSRRLHGAFYEVLLMKDERMINFWNDVWLHDSSPLKLQYIESGPLDETIRICGLVDAQRE
ncbi:hypothetical protein GOBAR_DD33011 [Gossypium barbadense]|nr:hypothetical protein GOBAR_DD33011 [Gossypium barbadense]